MKEAGVEKVFIATDGVDGEREELKEEFGDSVYFYNPTPEEEKKFKKGGVAIIDQDGFSNKVGRILLMVVVSMLPHAEIG